MINFHPHDFLKTLFLSSKPMGVFPMRVKLTTHSVAWIESEVQNWIAMRIDANEPLVET